MPLAVPLHDRPCRETGMTRAEWAAVCGLRQLGAGLRCGSLVEDRSTVTRDLHQAATAFLSHGVPRPELNPTGRLSITRDERRLLKALAAAQAGEDWQLDLTLFKLAPQPHARHKLADAITALGSALATLGHWLPAPAAIEPVAVPPPVVISNR